MIHISRSHFPKTAEGQMQRMRSAELASLQIATAKNENVLDAKNEHDMRAFIRYEHINIHQPFRFYI